MSDGPLFHPSAITPMMAKNAEAQLNRASGAGVLPGLDNQTAILSNTVESNDVW